MVDLKEIVQSKCIVVYGHLKTLTAYNDQCLYFLIAYYLRDKYSFSILFKKKKKRFLHLILKSIIQYIIVLSNSQLCDW